MRRLAVLLAVSATLACGGSDSSGPSDLSVSGSYILLSVNGTALPFTVSSTVQITEGTMRVDAGHTFSTLTTRRQTVAGVSTNSFESTSGSWSRSGTTLTMTTGAGTSETGNFIVGSNEITIVRIENGTSLTYRYKM